jgi:hypothetical protein
MPKDWASFRVERWGSASSFPARTAARPSSGSLPGLAIVLRSVLPRLISLNHPGLRNLRLSRMQGSEKRIDFRLSRVQGFTMGLGPYLSFTGYIAPIKSILPNGVYPADTAPAKVADQDWSAICSSQTGVTGCFASATAPLLEKRDGRFSGYLLTSARWAVFGCPLMTTILGKSSFGAPLSSIH